MASNQILLWDFDGTLALRRGGWAGALHSVLLAQDDDTPVAPQEIAAHLQRGFPWHAPEIEHTGLSADEWWSELSIVFARAYQAVGIERARARELSSYVRESYLALRGWQVYEDAFSTLNHLSGMGWRHFILSNHVPELRQLLDGMGLSSHFEQVFNSADTGWEKPNPHAFRTALRHIGEDPTSLSAWMIGDSLKTDVRGAMEAGLSAVLVHSASEAVLDSTISFCENLTDLIGFFRNLQL